MIDYPEDVLLPILREALPDATVSSEYHPVANNSDAYILVECSGGSSHAFGSFADVVTVEVVTLAKPDRRAGSALASAAGNALRNAYVTQEVYGGCSVNNFEIASRPHEQRGAQIPTDSYRYYAVYDLTLRIHSS